MIRSLQSLTTDSGSRYSSRRLRLAEINHHRWVKRSGILKGFQTNEELEVWVFLNLLHQFFVREVKASLDDQSTERHVKWLGGRAKPLTELRSVVILQFIPGNELGQVDPAIVARELAAKWQKGVCQ